jgi:Fe2+ transport system protein FeoA
LKLLELKQGDTAVVDKLDGDKNTKARMDGFGIREGKQIRMIKAAPFKGPLLVEDVSSGARMMISRGMASQVEVSRNETQG